MMDEEQKHGFPNDIDGEMILGVLPALSTWLLLVSISSRPLCSVVPENVDESEIRIPYNEKILTHNKINCFKGRVQGCLREQLI